MIGNVPCSAARRVAAAASSSSTTSSIAAGAERDLGVAAVHAALADERRLLVAERARRSAARRAARSRSPTIAASSRRSPAASRAGCRARSSTRVVPAGRGRASLQPGDRGVGRVGHVHARRSTASTRPTCRRCRSRGRRPRPRSSSWSSSHCTLVADWFGRDAHAVGAQREARRRSCGGPASRARARPARRSRGPTRSSTPRWLEMPTASTGPGGVERGACASVEARRRHHAPRRTPRGRRRGSRGAARARPRARTWPSARDDRGAHAARADVDDEHASRSSSGSRPGEIAERAREPELAGVEDAVRVERVLHRTAARRSRRRARRRRSGPGSGRRRGGGSSAPPAASTARCPASHTAR